MNSSRNFKIALIFVINPSLKSVTHICHSIFNRV